MHWFCCFDIFYNTHIMMPGTIIVFRKSKSLPERKFKQVLPICAKEECKKSGFLKRHTILCNITRIVPRNGEHARVSPDQGEGPLRSTGQEPAPPHWWSSIYMTIINATEVEWVVRICSMKMTWWQLNTYHNDWLVSRVFIHILHCQQR